FVEDADVHPQPERLNFARVNRQQWIAEHEATDDVRPARDARKLHVFPDVLIDPAELIDRQWRAGREDRPQLRQIARLARPDPGLLARGDEPRAGAKVCDPEPLGHSPQVVYAGMGWAALVEHDGGAY